MDAEERDEYERLCRRYQRSIYPLSPTLAKAARDHVAWRREREATLGQRLVSELHLSWLDKLTLYRGYRIIRRKIMSRQAGNWQTSLIGFVAALALYFQQNGGKLPETWPEWKVALLAALVAAFGWVSKDASTGSRPGAKGSASLLALPFVALLAVFTFGCGDKTSVQQLTCFNNGDGTQQCIDGSGNVTDSPCVSINGALATTTGQACDASSSSTIAAPTPTEGPI